MFTPRDFYNKWRQRLKDEHGVEWEYRGFGDHDQEIHMRIGIEARAFQTATVDEELDIVNALMIKQAIERLEHRYH